MSVNIKKCFKSRWEDGYIVEADFSQLEVVGAAIVSGDENMKQDLLDGIDSHSQSAAWLNPQYSYEEILSGYKAEDAFFTKLRKNAKGPRFELQYGAGAKSIAENNNLTRDEAQGFIDRYYERYATLRQFQQSVREEVEKNLKPIDEYHNGVQVEEGTYVSITGRRYKFKQQPAPKFLRDKGVMLSISPTQIANYPMQGFATGDIVPEVLGRIHRALTVDDDLWNYCLPINTVHDSIIFDVRENALQKAGRTIKEVMQAAPRWMKMRFNVDIDLPLNVDVEYGKDWSSLTKLEIK
jgi:DNA polymerase I-like protein with 3'-5' exonuclease and polymerase domains